MASESQTISDEAAFRVKLQELHAANLPQKSETTSNADIIGTLSGHLVNLLYVRDRFEKLGEAIERISAFNTLLTATRRTIENLAPIGPDALRSSVLTSLRDLRAMVNWTFSRTKFESKYPEAIRALEAGHAWDSVYQVLEGELESGDDTALFREFEDSVLDISTRVKNLPGKSETALHVLSQRQNWEKLKECSSFLEKMGSNVESVNILGLSQKQSRSLIDSRWYAAREIIDVLKRMTFDLNSCQGRLDLESSSYIGRGGLDLLDEQLALTDALNIWKSSPDFAKTCETFGNLLNDQRDAFLHQPSVNLFPSHELIESVKAGDLKPVEERLRSTENFRAALFASLENQSLDLGELKAFRDLIGVAITVIESRE